MTDQQALRLFRDLGKRDAELCLLGAEGMGLADVDLHVEIWLDAVVDRNGDRRPLRR